MKNRLHAPEYAPSGSPAREPLYRRLANLLRRDIAAGRPPPGHALPTEDELRERHRVSRHTVRQALQALKDEGLVTSRAGVGTIVLAAAPESRFFSAIGRVAELLQFVGTTEMHVISRQEFRADELQAAVLRCEPGQPWVEFCILRRVPGQPRPLHYLQAFLPPEFAGVIGRRKVLRQPIHRMVEEFSGLRIVDVLQEITAARLPADMSEALEVPEGEAAMRISRFYSDAQGRVVTIGIGHYPSGRYVQRTRFRAHAPGEPRGPR